MNIFLLGCICILAGITLVQGATIRRLKELNVQLAHGILDLQYEKYHPKEED